MSIPSEVANEKALRLLSGKGQNIVAQNYARHILQEVEEIEIDCPDFDPHLTEKAVHIAYSLIACGCSIVECKMQKDAGGKAQTIKKKGSELECPQKDIEEGLLLLEKAGKILSDTFKNNHSENNRDYNLLISGMCLFAAKQYSRAFITLNDINIDFGVGQVIKDFIRKDFTSLIASTNKIFFSSIPPEHDLDAVVDWIIPYEVARCFMMVLDHIHSNNETAFSEIDMTLEKLSDISVEINHTLYWIIIRLLRIFLSTFKDASLWTVLPPKLPMNEFTMKYIQLLSVLKPPTTELWPSQIEGLDKALGENSGAVVNLRTSGGKTRVAELTILKSLSCNPSSKILYLAPFRSLASEVEQSLDRVFSPLGVKVTQLYGGATINASDFKLIEWSQIIVATPEKAKALIRGGSGIEAEVKLIIVDEGHILGYDERHVRNEIFLTHLKEYATRNNARIILLSAVLPNPEDLANWIVSDTALIAKSDWKPSLERTGYLIWNGQKVDLRWRVDEKPSNLSFVQRKLMCGSKNKYFPNGKEEAVAATALRLAKNGTVMIYVGRANMVKGYAKSVLLALEEKHLDFNWDETLWSVFQNICFEELDKNDIVLEAARKGVICHSDKLPPLVRIAIEELMRSKPPLVVIATNTLGQGVNIGISTVIVANVYLDDKPINNRDFWNICGRAGRAYSNGEGKILYVIDATKEPFKVRNDIKMASNYFKGVFDPVKSGLLIALEKIKEVADKAGVNFDVLIEAIANDFIDQGVWNGKDGELKNILDLIDDGLLAMHEEFCDESDDVDWVDDLFRRSLAIIQANADEKEQYVRMIKARVLWVTNKVDKTKRNLIMSTGMPFSTSCSILRDIEDFRTLANDFIDDRIYLNKDSIVAEYIRKIEVWAQNNAKSIQYVKDYSPNDLDSIREDWIAGISFACLSKKNNKANNTIKKYWGYTLPWIIHSVAQIFKELSDESSYKVYSLLALLIELGLPDEDSANVYLAGIRSRCAAVEISMLEFIRGKTVLEIKEILINFSSKDVELSEDALVWIDRLCESHHTQPEIVSFPAFRLDHEDAPDRLYIREESGRYYLISYDDTFEFETISTEDLPFEKIANKMGLFFERIDGTWELRTHNPLIHVNNQ